MTQAHGDSCDDLLTVKNAYLLSSLLIAAKDAQCDPTGTSDQSISVTLRQLWDHLHHRGGGGASEETLSFIRFNDIDILAVTPSPPSPDSHAISSSLLYAEFTSHLLSRPPRAFLFTWSTDLLGI